MFVTRISSSLRCPRVCVSLTALYQHSARPMSSEGVGDEALPRELIIDEGEVTKGALLGSGAFGDVFAGTLRGLPICIKVRALRQYYRYCWRRDGWSAAPHRRPTH